MMKYYAGIGSRETPDHICRIMTNVASALEGDGWILRSGAADGADTAFERGVKIMTNKEIFLPWSGYNARTPGQGVYAGFASFDIGNVAMKVAEHHHPNWAACSQGARKMHSRNVLQIMGPSLEQLSAFVVCWTPNGSGSGGTGQAIRIANACEVPVFDLGKPDLSAVLNEIEDFVESYNLQNPNQGEDQ
jgi:hypothetical protein